MRIKRMMHAVITPCFEPKTRVSQRSGHPRMPQNRRSSSGVWGDTTPHWRGAISLNAHGGRLRRPHTPPQIGKSPRTLSYPKEILMFKGYKVELAHTETHCASS